MIQITVNGESVEIPKVVSLAEVLESVDVPPNYLAVEVNAEVVPRENFSTLIICGQDQLEVVTLVGGG